MDGVENKSHTTKKPENKSTNKNTKPNQSHNQKTNKPHNHNPNQLFTRNYTCPARKAACFCAFMDENWMTEMPENWEVTDRFIIQLVFGKNDILV